MATAAAQGGRDNAEHPQAVRVILVGRTGLDGRLRLDPDVELVRVRTPLEAVGELADPLGAAGGAPGRSVVIVAPDADPAVRRGADGNGTQEDHSRAGEFLAALRHIDPSVRVLRLETSEGDAPARAGYDGVVRADSPADSLRAELRGPAQVHAEEPVVVGTTEHKEAMSGLAGRRAMAWSEAGDEALVRLMIQGRDITDSAVEMIRRRFPGKNVRYVPAELAEVSPPLEEPCHQASVGWRGRAMGVLRSHDIPAELLAPHASWLAAWLALRDQHVQLRDAAFSDPLTGAYNRRFFDQFLGVAAEQARRQRLPLTVLVFDIDNFKTFNDHFGHGAGDEILKETVKLLRSVIRPGDKVCRIGGDEFAVIFHEPKGPRTPTSRPPTNIYPIAQRFQKAILDHKFPKLGREAPATLTISGGLATYPWDGADAESLLARADELAMQSKKSGKNCITLGPGAERFCNGEHPQDEPTS